MHKIKLIIFVAQLAFSMLDARVTKHNMQIGGYELNPMVRPIAKSNAIYFDFIGESAASFLIGKKLERTHPKISKFCFAWQMEDLASHSSGYIFSERNSTQWQNQNSNLFYANRKLQLTEPNQNAFIAKKLFLQKHGAN